MTISINNWLNRPRIEEDSRLTETAVEETQASRPVGDNEEMINGV